MSDGKKVLAIKVDGTLCRIDVNEFLDGNRWFPCDDGDDCVIGDRTEKYIQEEIDKRGWNPGKNTKPSWKSSNPTETWKK